ncbi:MAG: hypothetical protein ACRD5L_10785, partial [Bryobacteraceae bacterium]
SVWTASVSRVKPNPTEMAATPAPTEIATAAPAPADADFRMIRDLPVLENYDVLSKFDALSELPEQPLSGGQRGETETR